MTRDEAVEFLREIVDDGANVSDPEEGVYCFFCGTNYTRIPHLTERHSPTCVFVRVRDKLAQS